MNRRTLLSAIIAAPLAATAAFAAAGKGREFARTGESGPEMIGLPRSAGIKIGDRISFTAFCQEPLTVTSMTIFDPRSGESIASYAKRI